MSDWGIREDTVEKAEAEGAQLPSEDDGCRWLRSQMAHSLEQRLARGARRCHDGRCFPSHRDGSATHHD